MNFYQDIFFRSMDFLRGRHTINRLHFLRQSQNWSVAEIQEWQLKKLNELLEQAKNNSKFYQDRLEGNNTRLNRIEDITKIEILTKDDIRNNQLDIRCSNIPENRFVESRTGGSTGEPMFYFWDKRGMDWNRASVYRSGEWAGSNLGEKAIHMSGSHFDYNQAESIKNKIVYFLQRYKDFSVAYITDELFEIYYNEMLKYKPTSIWGYASGLNMFAEYIESQHPKTDFSFIKAIMTSSEMLLPEQRDKINKVFGGNKVFDQYGSRELYIAAECNQHNGYHIHAETIFAEIVDADGNWCKPGEMGRIVLTDLSNHAFPFIRYDIGDLGVMDKPIKCECGMSLPKIKNLQGRIADVVVLKDRYLTPPNFATLFSDIRGIKAYQIRQDKIDAIEVVLVPDNNYSSDFEKYIRKSIESMVDNQATIKISLQDKIDVPESGKRRFVVSTVSKSIF